MRLETPPPRGKGARPTPHPFALSEVEGPARQKCFDYAQHEREEENAKPPAPTPFALSEVEGPARQKCFDYAQHERAGGPHMGKRKKGANERTGGCGAHPPLKPPEPPP